MSGLQWQRPSTALGLILLVVAMAYANSFGNGWHYDDIHTITENPHIRSLEDPVGFFTDRTRFSRDAEMAMFRPMLVLSLAINYWWSQLDTSTYLFVNLCIHLGCTMLLWVLLRQLGRGAGLALFGAMLFGLHPLATEPVNYISARSESLSALFVLATMVTHLVAREQILEPRKIAWRFASLLCFAAAMMSKETGITALGLVVAYDLTRGSGTWRSAHKSLHPVHAVYAVIAVVYLVVQFGHINVAVVDAPVRERSTQLATQIKALIYYARLLVMPHGLNVQHQFFEGGLASVVGASLLALSSLALIARRAREDVRFGLGWCIIVLSPTLLVPLHILVNDHRLYLPVAGLLVALTCLWTRPARCRWPSRWVSGLAICTLLIVGVLTQNRNPVWANEYSLWSDAAAKSPHPLVPVAYVHLGNYAKEHGALSEARGYYQRALEIAPQHVAARNNLGLVLEAMGEVSAAADTFAALTRDHPALAEGWYNLGHALQALGREAARAPQQRRAQELLLQARHAYEHVADTSYHYDLALNNVGTTFELLGRIDSAAVYYRQAAEYGGVSVDPHNNLRRLSRQLDVYAGDLIDAKQLVQLQTLCEQLAQVEDPAPEALFYLAISLFSQGHFKESLAPNERLLREHPDFILGYLQLGNLLETLGRRTEAHRVYEQQLLRQPEGHFADEARRRLKVESK
ncbi:MAG: tetratricopeptide repeat protein [Gemmatimonadetes bacterium]|nr:tetratricopeptide repeat protein [Gemmatimonadota bacterium]